MCLLCDLRFMFISMYDARKGSWAFLSLLPTNQRGRKTRSHGSEGWDKFRRQLQHVAGTCLKILVYHTPCTQICFVPCPRTSLRLLGMSNTWVTREEPKHNEEWYTMMQSPKTFSRDNARSRKTF